MLLRFRREDIEPAAPQTGRNPPERDTDGRSRPRACEPLTLTVEDPESILLLQFSTLSRVKGDKSEKGDNMEAPQNYCQARTRHKLLPADWLGGNPTASMIALQLEGLLSQLG